MTLGEKLRTCYFLLPGYELDEYPRYLPSEEADLLLAGWCALWHPKLLATCESIPAWQQAQSAPGDLDGLLIVIPDAALDQLTHEYENEASEQTCLVKLSEFAAGSKEKDWQAIQSAILNELGFGASEPPGLNQASTKRLCCPWICLPANPVDDASVAIHFEFGSIALCGTSCCSRAFLFVRRHRKGKPRNFKFALIRLVKNAITTIR